VAYISKNPKFDGMILDDQASDSVTAPKSGSYKLINRNGSLFNVDSSGVEAAVGSGAAGEINYIDEWDAEIAVADWNLYKDTAQSTPVDGTGDGGSASITWTRQSSVILRGTQSYKLTKTAADLEGEGVSYDFDIKTQDTNKKLKIQFDYKTDEDAAYAAGDLTVYVYDKTNSTLITPVDTDIPRGQNIFQTSFNSTGSTSYRLIFHVADTLSTAWDAYIDNIIVGPGMTSQGAAVGNIDLAITAAGFGSTSNETYNCTRIGNLLRVHGTFDPGTSSGTASLTLPSGHTIDNGNHSAAINDGYIIGQWMNKDSSFTSVWTNDRMGPLFYTGNGNLDTIYFGKDVGGSSNLDKEAGTTIAPTNEPVDVEFTVPIAEWSGQGIVPMLAEDNLSEWQSWTPTWVNAASSPSTNSGYWRRVGGDMEIAFRRIEANSDGTGASMILELPSGYTYDLSKIPSSPETSSASGVIKGSGGWYDSSGGVVYGLIAAPGGSTNRISFSRTDGDTVGFILGSEIDSSDEFNGTFIIPVTEFAGSQNSLVGYSLASTTQTGLVSTGTQSFAGTKSFEIEDAAGYHEIKNTEGTTVDDFLRIVGDETDNSNLPGIQFRGGTKPSESNYPEIGLSNSGLSLDIYGGEATTENIRANMQLSSNNSGNGYIGFTHDSSTYQRFYNSSPFARFTDTAGSFEDSGAAISAYGQAGMTMNNRSTASSGRNQINFEDLAGDNNGEIESTATANTTNYSTSSDARLKHMREAFDALEMLNRMNPAKFERVLNPGVVEYGFIAQELYEVVPQAVKVGGDNPRTDPWQVDYAKVAAVLAQGIKQLAKRVKYLEAQTGYSDLELDPLIYDETVHPPASLEDLEGEYLPENWERVELTLPCKEEGCYGSMENTSYDKLSKLYKHECNHCGAETEETSDFPRWDKRKAKSPEKRDADKKLKAEAKLKRREMLKQGTPEAKEKALKERLERRVREAKKRDSVIDKLIKRIEALEAK